ncbi:MAG: tetratricopeptide repeat protein [Phycisphaerales bacterium]|nr:MAG: tetratricopeptide repeat protein [Phycisphaerales bacterium]
MPDSTVIDAKPAAPKPDHEQLLNLIARYFAAAREVRRGICLLQAGDFEKAAEVFAAASHLGSVDKSLPAYLAACLVGQGRGVAAADHLGASAKDVPDSLAAEIRHAMVLWVSGRRDEAVTTLRESIRENPECAELHFQLGTLLSALELYEEAELRFTQSLNIDRSHTEAFVSLAMCCGIRGAPAEAVGHLQKAQACRPHDARIGLLLAQAAAAMHQKGQTQRVRAAMPEDNPLEDASGIDELSQVIEREPEFVDAFLALPAGEVDDLVFSVLLKTLRKALERQPELAELHYHCGRVLSRLGRHTDAINANERAVAINPRFTHALIELAELYSSTDRNADAVTRLEEAIEAGAKYADVFCLLGNSYRAVGKLEKARSAYRHALLINDGYKAAREALASLPA